MRRTLGQLHQHGKGSGGIALRDEQVGKLDAGPRGGRGLGDDLLEYQQQRLAPDP